MSLAHPHLPNFPRLLFQMLCAEGYTPEVLLKDTGIRIENLDDERFRLSNAQHERFIRRAMEVTDNPHLGLRIGKRSTTGNTNLFVMVVANSGRVSRAIQLVECYSRIYTRTLSLRLEPNDGQPYFQIQTNVQGSQVTYFAVTTFALFLDSMVQGGQRKEHLVQRLELTVPQPSDFDRVSGEFGFPVLFSQSHTRLWFHPEVVDKPLKEADPQTVRLLLELCDRQLEAAKNEETFKGRVQELLFAHINSPPNLAESANLLGVSSRTMRRNLQAEGTTFQLILDEVRLSMASRLLQQTDDPVSTIGYELGFESASHFGRAFKRWTGKTPLQFRRSNAS